jgi:enoyl-CoA hydratase
VLAVAYDAPVNEPTPPPHGDWLGSKFLRLERHGSIAVISVDRPKRRNALTPSMYYGVKYAVDHLNRSEDLAAIVITGTGDVFIPGGDLAGEDETPWAGLEHVSGMDITPFEHIRNSRKPIVSAINGICQGGGLLIAMLSDVSVAVPDSTFRAPELMRGIADTGYAEYLPSQIGPARARDMLLTARTIDARTAVDWGLVARLADPSTLLEDAIEVARTLTFAAPQARLVVKREINRQYDYFDRVSMEASLFSDEYREGLEAFKERRPPAWIPEDLRPDGRI